MACHTKVNKSGLGRKAGIKASHSVIRKTSGKSKTLLGKVAKASGGALATMGHGAAAAAGTIAAHKALGSALL